MQLYIQVVDGVTVNHPALEENLLEAFGGQIPEGWEPFLRHVDIPVGVYEILENYDVTNPVYEKQEFTLDDNSTYMCWTDVYPIRPMTDEEKAGKQGYVRKVFMDARAPYQSNFSAWILDEATCTMVPPVERPAIGSVPMRWCGAENNWKEAPLKPTDGNPYEFNFNTWQWDPVTDVTT